MHTKQWSLLGRTFVFIATIIALLSTSAGGIYPVNAKSEAGAPLQVTVNYPIVFVSRKIPTNGSVYYSSGGSLPGVQPYSRFQVAAPGKLLVRETNGTIRTLIDGSKPSAATMNLIDVGEPSVSYDATKIVFAGLPSGSYSSTPVGNPGAWRIYMINADGTGLKQITFSDRNIDLSQFGSQASSFTAYDDTDPVFLPDGRIVFSSTRWPSFGMYGAARTSNLYVVNADGSNLHRITAERNGGERPVVDPLTGKIVYSRWWRNFRLGTNNMTTMVAPEGGYIMKDGICALSHQGAECQEAGGLTNLERNSWMLATINPDGTGLAQFAGVSKSTFAGEIVNHAYGGDFASDGTFYANFYPMANGTEAAGFGGIRRYTRGANGYTPIIGITTRDEDVQQFVAPSSYGVYVGNYATDPAVLPEGGLVISWAKDTKQDYGLYTINNDGSGLTLLYDNPGTTELRAHLLRARTVPTIIPDKVTKVASLLPPSAQGPYDIDGTFTFKDLNVYFNAPVDTNIINAMPVGSANTIRFFIDHQRSQQRGSFETLDWPILLQEVLINPDGSISANGPANVPLFEQIRTSQANGYTIPITGPGLNPQEMPGAAHVAGENFGRTNESMTCVGCHAGHTMIQVPANAADAQWTNLATGATVTVSSTGSGSSKGINDRRVKRNTTNNGSRYWVSQSGSPNTQWVQLTFPVPVTVRTVRLYNPASANSSIKVLDATVRLYSDAAGKVEVANKNSGALTDSGTNVNFSEVLTRVVRIQFNSVNGNAAALGEVEVIARGESPNAVSVPTSTITPTAAVSVTPTGTLATTTATTPLASETVTSTPTLGISPTSTFTPVVPSSTPTTIPQSSPTAGPTFTSVPPSNTPTAIVLASPTALPTNTAEFTPTATAVVLPSNTPAVTTLPPSSGIMSPATIKNTRGTTSGSLSSLSLLQQQGAADDPAAYVTFKAPRKGYVGYQSFVLPASITPSSISSVQLDLNYKAARPSNQTWTISIYNWKTKKWVKIGATVNMRNAREWVTKSFTIANFQRYVSSGNEVRIQLTSNNGNGDLKVDYEVITVTVGSAPQPAPTFTTVPVNSVLQPAETFTPIPTYEASPTPTQ
ncbi:MAG: hypothetical protein QM730_12275 [Anaerolineales bacterium]